MRFANWSLLRWFGRRSRAQTVGFGSVYPSYDSGRSQRRGKFSAVTGGAHRTSPEFKRKVLSLDSAFKTGQSNDFSCIQVCGEAQNGFCSAGQLEISRRVSRVEARFASSGSQIMVLIRGTASGQSLIQELRVSTSLPLKPIKPDKDKVTRATAITPLLESGRVFFRKQRHG